MSAAIHPSVGVARLGNSKEQFYLAPDAIGGLPYEVDNNGQKAGPVNFFKDAHGRVRRQGQLFQVFDDSGLELTLDREDVDTIVWTVHLANKKAAWYQYNELQGNLLYPDNSYEKWGTELRNQDKTTPEDRQALIVDPGPRTVSGPNDSAKFDEDSVDPAVYPNYHFPPSSVEYGTPIKTLGDLKTDSLGRLIVLGGKGHAGGDQPLESYGGSDTWHDDTSDGPVYCTVTFKDPLTPDLNLKAWCIVGSPDYAPEIVNISNLSDTMFDVGVRHFNLVPRMYADGAYKPNFIAHYERDILPIIQRVSRYQWVANVQSMMAFASNIFDFTDNRPSNRANRMTYYQYFREMNAKTADTDQPQNYLFKGEYPGQGDVEVGDVFPMMPLNSGSNSVSNDTIVKFDALNDTQMFLLGQWAKGYFTKDAGIIPNLTTYNVNSMDQASVGNCVGLPMCPGIEVTWTLQNPEVYEDSYIIKDAGSPNSYNADGLTASRDECEGGGCEPGDLTKRMACPWQADFFQCTIQYINFTDPAINKEIGGGPGGKGGTDMQPLVPTFYSYWWPPQSPWDVLAGGLTQEEQQHSHVSMGQQVNYARGINSFVQMVEHWDALAFIRDLNSNNAGFPFFTETERNHELFTYKEVPVSDISHNEEDDETTIPVFFISECREKIRQKGSRGLLLAEGLAEKAFKKIKTKVRTSQRTPRSGGRSRR